MSDSKSSDDPGAWVLKNGDAEKDRNAEPSEDNSNQASGIDAKQDSSKPEPVEAAAPVVDAKQDSVKPEPSQADAVTSTQEWLAVPKPRGSIKAPSVKESTKAPSVEDETKRKPSPSEGKGPARVLTPERVRGVEGVRSTVSRWRKLSAGLKQAQRQLREQQIELARINSEIEKAAGHRAEIERKAEAELSVTRAAADRAEKGLQSLGEQLSSQRKDADERLTALRRAADEQNARQRAAETDFAKAMDRLELEFASEATATKTELASQVAAMEARFKGREQTTRGQVAKAAEKLEQELAAQATAAKQEKQNQDEGREKLTAALDRLELRLDSEAERLEKKVESDLQALEQRLKKEEQARRRELSAATKEEVVSQMAAAEERLKKREQTTRGQLAAAIKRFEAAEATIRAQRAEGSASKAAKPAARSARKPAAKAAARPSPKPAARRVAKSPLPEDQLDINRLSFEQFRALGLSVTQATRLVATREARGGFSETDEIDTVRGLPRRTRNKLKQKLIVG